MAKKSAILLALGMPKGKSGAAEPDGGDEAEDMGGSAKRDAASDLISAVKAGDVAGVEAALTAHFRACQASEYGEDETGEEG